MIMSQDTIGQQLKGDLSLIEGHYLGFITSVEFFEMRELLWNTVYE